MKRAPDDIIQNGLGGITKYHNTSSVKITKLVQSEL